MIRVRNLRRDRGGAAALEFGLVAGIFLPLCLAVLDVGLLLWTNGALQSTASLTARCAAIASPSCTDVQQFAVTTAGNWIFPGIITKTNVNPAPAVVCVSHSAFMKVTITCQFWMGGLLPPPFAGQTLSVVAYFPASVTPC